MFAKGWKKNRFWQIRKSQCNVTCGCSRGDGMATLLKGLQTLVTLLIGSHPAFGFVSTQPTCRCTGLGMIRKPYKFE